MRRAVRRTLIVLALGGAVAAAAGPFEAGRYLQHEDPLERADALYVLGGSRMERSLEAVDLFHAGYATAILLSPGPEEPAEAAVRAKGIPFPREAESARDALTALGIPRASIVIGEQAVDSTAEEATLLKAEAARRGWHTVIVVTSKYHTRRAGFAMRRGLEGTGVRVVVRATRYDRADPAHWWRRRGDVRFLMEEWPKVIAYRLGLAE